MQDFIGPNVGVITSDINRNIQSYNKSINLILTTKIILFKVPSVTAKFNRHINLRFLSDSNTAEMLRELPFFLSKYIEINMLKLLCMQLYDT